MLTTQTDYRRFREQWAIAHAADSEFQGVPFPSDRFELPSPEIGFQQGNLPTVPEPHGNGEAGEDTP